MNGHSWHWSLVGGHDDLLRTPSAGDLCVLRLGLAAVLAASLTVAAQGAPGIGVNVEVWTRVPGNDVVCLREHPDYPERPHSVRRATRFELPTDGLGENYGARMRAFLVPKTTGSYTFWVAADDQGELWLSKSSEPAGMSRIAHVPEWTGPNDWTKFPEQASEPVLLTAGTRYYIEAVMKEGGGGDHLSVAWQGPGLAREIVGGASLEPLSIEYEPVLIPDRLVALPGQSTRTDPTANDRCLSDSWRLSSVTEPQHGRAVLGSDSTVAYTPSDGYVGADSFTYVLTNTAQRRRLIGPVAVMVQPPLDLAGAQQTILAGVRKLPAEFATGQQALMLGPAAEPLFTLTGREARGMATVAVASVGSGRVSILPDGVLSAWQIVAKKGDAARFLRQLIGWSSNSPAPRLVTDCRSVAEWLKQGEYRVVLSQRWWRDLQDANVLILGSGSPAPEGSDALVEFVRGGGGAIIGLSENDGEGSRLLLDAGLAVGPKVPAGTGCELRNLPVPGTNWAAILQSIREAEPIPRDRLFRGAAAANTAAVLKYAASRIPLADLGQLGAASVGPAVTRYNETTELTPTMERPVSDPLDVALLRLEAGHLKTVAPQDARAHRSVLIEDSWGMVPADAERVVGRVNVDTTCWGYTSTGLYAAPGETVTVSVPDRIVGKGFSVRIGDMFGGKLERLTRMPDVEREFPVNTRMVEAVNPFGGMVFLKSPVFGVAPAAEGIAPFEVAVANVIRAPLFVLGETTDEQWRSTIRDYPAPRAELWSPHVAFTVQSSDIRSLDNPTAAMRFWDDWVALYDDVGGMGHLRTTPERLCCDVLLGGYAGHPIHGHVSWTDEILQSWRDRRAPSTGTLHELAHEAQRRPDKSWGFGRSNPYTINAEETIALFATCAIMEYCDRVDRYSWIRNRFYADEAMRDLLAGTRGERTPRFHGGEYMFGFTSGKEVCSFLARCFGKQGVRAFMESYNRDFVKTPSALPRTKPEKRDQWLIHWSAATGYDMTRLLVHLARLEVSDEALAKVKAMGLPDFLPAIGGISEAVTLPGTPLTLNLAAEALSFDGVAQVRKVTQPDHGKITASKDGLWIYRPEGGFSGTDSFTYETVSSTGFVFKNEATIRIAETCATMEVFRDVRVESLEELPAVMERDADEVGLHDSFQLPWRLGANYGVRMRGCVTPETTGKYTFYPAASGPCQVYLSVEGTPGTRRRIVSATKPTAPRSWKHAGAGWWRGARSEPIFMEEGKRYQLEAVALQRDRSEDHLSLAWQSSSSGGPVCISGAVLTPPEHPRPLTVPGSVTYRE